MAKCKSCGTALPANAPFCLNCGASIEVETESPYVKKAPKKNNVTQYIIPIILIFGILAVIALIYPSLLPDECEQAWHCTDWSECVDSKHTRICIDANNCPIEGPQPETVIECVVVPVNETENITNQTLIELPECAALGEYCDESDDCCRGYCVHHTCLNTTIYCGDGYCDLGEDCSSCAYDCGSCPHDRDLEPNVFTEPLYSQGEDYKKDGYVLIKYYYSESCDTCYYPVNIESQLRDLAANFKDLIVLNIIDVQEHRREADIVTNIAGKKYVPFVKVEWVEDKISGYATFHGNQFGQILVDGDILLDLAQIICEHSEYCMFDGTKIVRTSP